jgi:hypothetical protein
MTFIDALEQQANFDYTENGAVTHKTSLSKCVDFFATGGSIRSWDDSAILNLFTNAFSENQLATVRLAFMFRDVRGGQGQRRPFRIQLKWLAINYPTPTEKLLDLVAEYGRWDDIYSVVDTSLEQYMLDLINIQIQKDVVAMDNNESISLLGKWLKRINTSSKESVRIGHKIRKYMSLDEKSYRKLCRRLNEYLNVAENKMASNNWDQIEYNKLPGQCLIKHRKAFNRNDEVRYAEFIAAAQAGKVKVNAKSLYPYQIIEKILDYRAELTPDEAEILWKNLADFDVDPNALVVADVSGSMSGLPINVCISLALYFSERAKGIYHNKFITFSENPTLQSVVGDTIHKRVTSINNAQWDMNTNLERVFDLVLNTAINYNIAPQDMVKTLYIISDMEFDSCVKDTSSGRIESFYDTMKQRFEVNGYKIPQLVFWNVNARPGNLPVTKSTENTCMISGFSPSILQYLGMETFPTPEEMMMIVVNSPRYSQIEF